MKWVEGGICAPLGFKAGGIHCGIRPNKAKNDLAFIVSDVPCTSAALFTKNAVKAAPVLVNLETVKSRSCRAVFVNSGIANACAPDDLENAYAMRDAGAEALGFRKEEVLVGSTGIIGQRLNIDAVKAGIPVLLKRLEHSAKGSDEAAHAIMTTDKKKKECAVEIELNGKTVRIGGISKGSGMIHPNMGTMLCYITTDCSIDADLLQQMLRDVCNHSFNRISIDGDTSTNDSLIMMANGLAGNETITSKNASYHIMKEALLALCIDLARRMAADGEGAKHLITCEVINAATEEEAERLSKSVVSSSLTKAAVFGNDANWGRVLCALGYSGVQFDYRKVDIRFSSAAGSITVCRRGTGVDFDEELAKRILSEKEVIIQADMKSGEQTAVCWGCDLTYDYVRINGDYRT